jgi:hypothetical protein
MLRVRGIILPLKYALAQEAVADALSSLLEEPLSTKNLIAAKLAQARLEKEGRRLSAAQKHALGLWE